MDVVVFGTGEYYRKNKELLKKQSANVVGFIDNNNAKVGTKLDDKLIVHPKDVNTFQYDKIVIMSMYSQEMTEQLLNLGIPEKKIYIYSIYNDNYKRGCHIYYPDSIINEDSPCNEKGRKILLISHELSLTGAPIVLLHAAKAIKENGDYPVVLSPIDGPLVDEFLKSGIIVMIDGRLSKHNWFFNEIISNFKMVIISTLVLGGVVDQFNDTPIPVMWWLHEGKITYEIFKNTIPKHFGKNIHIYTGGQYTKDYWQIYRSSVPADLLLYGVPDREGNYILEEKPNFQKEKIIFSIIGTIDTRKGQDIFIKAICSLPKEYIKKSEFWIIGRFLQEEFEERLKIMSKDVQQVKFINEMASEELDNFYKQSDVIVSTSRDDPMPVVLTEGMMFSKTCICSSNTGTASLVNDGNNGFVFESENYEELASKIIYLIDHPDQIEIMGKNARKTYEENFMYSSFKDRLKKEIDKLL